MNILFLTNHLNIGGITSYVFNLAKGLKAKGHNVYVASSGGQLATRFKEAGVVVIELPLKTKCEISPKIWFSFLKIRAYFKEKELDIIHANTRVTSVLAWLLHRTLAKPYISTCHGFFKIRFSRRVFPLWGLKVIAISEAVKNHLIKDFKVTDTKIRVVRHGINVNAIPDAGLKPKAQIKKSLGLGDGQVVGIIARLSEEKGHVHLIEAMAKVMQKIPSAQLLIVGEGRIKERLSALVKTLNIEKNVFFIPSVLDTEELLSILDVFVLPSSKEGLGLSLMEAMAAAVAVIGTDIGGIRDLIQNGINGLLVRPEDPDALASAIMELLADPVKAKSQGGNARVFIKQNFSLEKMVLQTERIYLECLA